MICDFSFLTLVRRVKTQRGRGRDLANYRTRFLEHEHEPLEDGATLKLLGSHDQKNQTDRPHPTMEMGQAVLDLSIGTWNSPLTKSSFEVAFNLSTHPQHSTGHELWIDGCHLIASRTQLEARGSCEREDEDETGGDSIQVSDCIPTPISSSVGVV
jgi:hypothetical protein